MAENPIFNKVGPLLRQAEMAAAGLHLHETTLGVAHNTESNVLIDRAALVTAQRNFVSTRTVKASASKTRQSVVRQMTPEILTGRDLLKPHLGRDYSQPWNAAGWTHRTLALPHDPDDLALLLETLAAYLTSHSAHENAPLNFTATRITALHTQLIGAIGGEITAQTANLNAKRARDAAIRTLVGRLRNLIKELSSLMPGDDARWYDFGFVPPAVVGAPGSIKAFVAHAGVLPQSVMLDWRDSDLATSYHVYVQIVGTDAHFNLNQTVHDSDATVLNLPAGGTVRFMIRAVNEHGEGPVSEVLELAV